MKSTTNKPLACDSLWNERQAHMAMQQSKEQVARDRIKARNAQALLSEQLRKERMNDIFWHRVRQVLTVIAMALIAYTLFNFAGAGHVS